MTLTRELFADALRKGHGRALGYVRQHGDAGVEDLLLEACLHAQTYDQQSEGNRGAWLMEMLAGLPNASFYYGAVVPAFVASTSSHDVEQMASMVRRMAERSVPGAREALYAKFERQEFSEWTIAPHIVALDRDEGLLHVARVFGHRLVTDTEFSLDDTRYWFEEKLGKELAAATLDRAAHVDEDVRRFRDAFSENDDASSHDQRPRLSLDEFLTVLSEGKRHIRGWAWRFGRRVTEDEQARLMQLVEREDDPILQAAMLMAFVTRPPAGPELFLRFAGSEVDEVRNAAIDVLALFADPMVSAFSHKLLAAGSVEGARLLALNYDQNQLDQLVSLLPNVVDARRLHDLGFDMLEVCRSRPEAASGLIWMYEATPCSFCRNSAVDQLVELKLLPIGIAAECRDDCNHETRGLVESREAASASSEASATTPDGS